MLKDNYKKIAMLNVNVNMDMEYVVDKVIVNYNFSFIPRKILFYIYEKKDTGGIAIIDSTVPHRGKNCPIGMIDNATIYLRECTNTKAVFQVYDGPGGSGSGTTRGYLKRIIAIE